MQVHKEYVEAGADILTTNTFRTNLSSLLKAGISDSSKYVAQAVELSRQAVRGKEVYIAGSNAPAEDCYQVERTLTNKQLQVNHSKHIDLLIDNGVDFILNETQSHFDEIQIICDHCDRNKIPYVISLYVDEILRLLSGEKLVEVITFLNNSGVLAFGFNCILPELFLKVTGSTILPNNWGFYLNCGSGLPTDKIINCGIQPDKYLESVQKLFIIQAIIYRFMLWFKSGTYKKNQRVSGWTK